MRNSCWRRFTGKRTVSSRTAKNSASKRSPRWPCACGEPCAGRARNGKRGSTPCTERRKGQTGNQKSEIRNQKSEIRNQKSEIRLNLPVQLFEKCKLGTKT